MPKCAAQSPWYKTLVSVKYFSSGVVICLGRKVFFGSHSSIPKGLQIGVTDEGGNI